MNAANYVGGTNGNSVRFGIGAKSTLVADLRALADGIEAEHIAVKGVETSEAVSVDEFPASILRLSFCLHRNAPSA